MAPPVPPPNGPPGTAEFPLNVQLVSVGLLSKLCTPPPLPSTRLPLNTQLETMGLLLMLNIPPPPSDGKTWSLKVQLVTTGLLVTFPPRPGGVAPPSNVVCNLLRAQIP